MVIMVFNHHTRNVSTQKVSLTLVWLLFCICNKLTLVFSNGTEFKKAEFLASNNVLDISLETGSPLQAMEAAPQVA